MLLHQIDVVCPRLVFRFVGRFMSRRERIEKYGTTPQHFTNIYIKNFPEEVDTDEKLRAMFETFGRVVSCKVMLDKDNKSRGFGFCSFDNPADAEKAVSEMNDKIQESGKTLYVGRAQKRYEREAELRARFAEGGSQPHLSRR